MWWPRAITQIQNLLLSHYGLAGAEGDAVGETDGEAVGDEAGDDVGGTVVAGPVEGAGEAAADEPPGAAVEVG